jgi:predicted transcriptional regulator of viral defense system
LTTTQASVPRARSTKANWDAGGYWAGETLYQFVQIKPERFFGTEKIWVGDARVVITDRERTLLDGLSMPQYCGDLAEVLHAFEVSRTNLDLERIVGYAFRLGDATVKRLGWVLEHEGVEQAKVERLRRLPVKGYRSLDPTGPRKGPYNRRWMIQENLSGKLGA